MISRRSRTADVLARAYERWGQLRDRSAVTWWLIGIARNCIAGYFRRRERRSSRQARLESLAGDGFSDDCPVAAAELSYDVERLRRFLRQLSEADQELISLRFDAALTRAEIANILGISQQNVRVRIFRALRRLRELMTSQEATAQSTATP
jgi:RNA polymerase sigma-70 factor (ECF subfamily)